MAAQVDRQGEPGPSPHRRRQLEADPLPAPRLITGLTDLPFTLAGGSVAVGNFDGVHRGHKAVLKMARDAADRLGGPAIALTFEPHPRSYFSGRPIFRLSPPEEKATLLGEAGMDATLSLPFGDLAEESAEGFIERVLVRGLAARQVCIGYDFRFGAARRGDAEMLRRAGRAGGFTVHVAPPMADETGPVSSSRIRKALASGDMALANDLLGHPWLMGGKVVAGQQIGRTLGYPTANIVLSDDVELAHGIYAVRVAFAGTTRDGVASFGRRPTFDNGAVLLEVFVLDFDGDLYGKRMDVRFQAFLRPELKFDGAAALIAQMDRDAADARALLASI